MLKKRSDQKRLKSKMVRRIVFGALAIIAMLAGCSSGTKAKAGPDTAPKSPAGSQPGSAPVTTASATPNAQLMMPVGHFVVIHDDGWQAKVTVSSLTKQTTPPTGSPPLQPGHVYVVAHVSYQCLAAGPCSYSDLGDWQAADPAGNGSVLEVGGMEPTLGAGDLPVGHMVAGYVSEDASAQANQLTFGDINDPEASWAIS